MSLRCRLSLHRYRERDEHGRVTCCRCGKRLAVVYATVPDPEIAGRQLTRPKTRGRR